MTATQTLKELKDKKKALLKELKDAAKAAFKEVSQELFEKNPILLSFSWDQYTPYFNDGDPCYFSANTDEPQMVFCVDGDEVEMEAYDVPNDERYVGNGKYETFKLVGVEREQRTAYNAVRKFLNQFDSDDFEEMFGDHVKVTVNKRGVDTDECSHD